MENSICVYIYVYICVYIDSTCWYILPPKYLGLFYFYFHLSNSIFYLCTLYHTISNQTHLVTAITSKFRDKPKPHIRIKESWSVVPCKHGKNITARLVIYLASSWLNLIRKVCESIVNVFIWGIYHWRKSYRLMMFRDLHFHMSAALVKEATKAWHDGSSISGSVPEV